jgi:hypothetical protein
MKTWIEEAYTLGYEAGWNAQILKNKEDQNRRLEDMLHHGKRIGRQEAMDEFGIVDISEAQFEAVEDDMEGI